MGNVLTLFCAGILVAADPGPSELWDEYEGAGGEEPAATGAARGAAGGSGARSTG